MSEREFPPAIALAKIKKIIQSLNLRSKTHYTDEHKLVATAELVDENNKHIQSGAGKGPDSLTGALAESIEHFSTFQRNKGQALNQNCELIATQKGAEHDGLLTGLPYRAGPIEAFKLTTLDNAETLYIPSIILCPTIEKDSWDGEDPNMQFLSRYSSNSGIAFGCTKAEAILHGANEVIERHILSCFFMAVCTIGPSLKLYSPSKALLTKALESTPHALSLAEQLQIIIIKDVMNIYFSVAIPKYGPGDFHISPIGSGCSLDICTAVQRAVTEQHQVHTLYDDTQEIVDRRSLDFLSRSKILRHLIDFEPATHLRLPTLDLPSINFNTSVPLQLRTLENNLIASGKTIYHRIISRYSDDGIVCQAYVPRLERFNLIRNGSWVAPQAILRQAPAGTL